MKCMIDLKGEFIPLPTPSEMGEWDRLTIGDFGIKGEILMENASLQCVWALARYGPLSKDRAIAVVAGSGNNGGDGFAMARHLHNFGYRVKVFHTRGLEDYRGDAKYHIMLAEKSGVPIERISSGELSLKGFNIVVDALLGTGFSGELRQDYLKMVEEINKQREGGTYILSVDIPSGLNGFTGRPSPEAVRADLTVTFEEPKVGLFLPGARAFVGDLFVGKIGIPSHIKEENPPSYFGITRHILGSIPSLGNHSHKGKAGHVLIIGGSRDLTGAATLCALGALRGGAGLVTVASPHGVGSRVRMKWPEIMTLALGERGDEDWKGEFLDDISSHLSRFDVVVLGPGIGREKGAFEVIKGYLSISHPPTVIDADALFHLSRETELYQSLGKEDIITPHPGEMARILSSSSSLIQEDRFAAIEEACTRLSCVVVLKGAGSLIKRKDSAVYISPVACGNLSIGGSGDVLSGVIASLRAQGMESLMAACAGVMWHGLAGELLQKKYPYRGNLATEIAELLPDVRREVEK